MADETNGADVGVEIAGQKVNRHAAYYARNSGKVRASNAAYRARNLEKVRAKRKTYYVLNKEKMRAYAVAWYAANLEKQYAHNATYRAKKRNASTNLTKKERAAVEEIYRQCRLITKLTGEQYHVDHKIALSRGGKHHPDNLQILTAVENIKKGPR